MPHQGTNNSLAVVVVFSFVSGRMFDILAGVFGELGR